MLLASIGTVAYGSPMPNSGFHAEARKTTGGCNRPIYRERTAPRFVWKLEENGPGLPGKLLINQKAAEGDNIDLAMMYRASGIVTLAIRATGNAPDNPRLQRLTDYIHTAVEKGWISRETATQALSSLESLRSYSARDLSVPDVGIGESGNVIYLWDSGEHHLEFELSPVEKPFLFYENRSSGHNWSAEAEAQGPFEESALQYLRLFC